MNEFELEQMAKQENDKSGESKPSKTLKEFVGDIIEDSKREREPVPLDIPQETMNKLKGLNATSLDITNEDDIENDNFVKLGRVIRESAISGWNMGIVKMRLGEAQTREQFSDQNEMIKTHGYPGISKEEIAEETQVPKHSDYINRMIQSDLAKEQKEAMENDNKTLEQYTFDKYPDYVAAARKASNRKDSIIEGISSFPVRFGMNLAGGFVEGVTDQVELSKMVGINILTGGLGGGETTFLSDLFLGALDNYRTANTETQILYGRDATMEEKAQRAAIGAGMQVGMTALGKGVRKIINIRAEKQADQIKFAQSEMTKRNYKAQYVKNEDGKFVEIDSKDAVNRTASTDFNDVEVDPQKIAKAMADNMYGETGMTDNLIRAEKLVVGGNWRIPDGEGGADQSFAQFNTRYNNNDINVSTPRNLETNSNMTYAEVQDLRASKSSVVINKVDKDGNVTEVPLVGSKKKDAVNYTLYTQKALDDVIRSIVGSSEALARSSENQYINVYDKGVELGNISGSVEYMKLASTAKMTLENSLSERITKPLDIAYNTESTGMVYKIGQAMGSEDYGKFVMNNDGNALAVGFVTGEVSGVKVGASGEWKPFNDSIMRTHEILFADQAKADILDSMTTSNKFSNILELDENGGISYKKNTGTILDNGDEGIIDLYINRKNALGNNVKNDYQRLGLTEPKDVVDVINATIEPDELNANAIGIVIKRNIDNAELEKANKILAELGIVTIGEDGTQKANRSNVMKGIMELENRYANETNYNTKKLMGEILESLYDPEKSPFKVRDKDGNVVGNMSLRDIVLQDYRDNATSIDTANKMNLHFQTRVQDAVIGKLRRINEAMKNGHLDDLIDDVKVTEKIDKVLTRVESALKDIDFDNIDSKIGSKSFQNDIKSLRELNEVYKFIDDEVFDYLDNSKYVDKEEFIKNKIDSGKSEANKSYENTKAHVEKSIEQDEINLESKRNEIETKKLQDIEKAESDLYNEEIALRQQFEDYKEYKKKAKQAEKTNAEFAEYERKSQEWNKAKETHEAGELEKQENYNREYSEWENKKAAFDDSENARFKEEEAANAKEYEEALANREKAIDEELQKRKEEKAKIIKEKKVTDKSNAEFEKANAERQSSIDNEYKKSMKDYEENQKAIKEAEEHNAKVDKETAKSSQEDEVPVTKEQMAYEKAKKEHDDWKKADKKIKDTTKQIQNLVDEHPELYDSIPDDIRANIKRKAVFTDNVEELYKALDSEELQYVGKGYQGNITIDGMPIKIDIPKGVYKDPTAIRKLLEKQLPKELLKGASVKKLQTMANKIANPKRYGIANLKSGRIEKEVLNYLINKYGKDAVDQVKSGEYKFDPKKTDKSATTGMNRLVKEAELDGMFNEIKRLRELGDKEEPKIPTKPKTVRKKSIKKVENIPEKIEVPKQMDKPSLEAIEKKYPKINIEDYAEEVTQKSNIKADRRSIEKEFPKPKKKKTEPIQKFKEKAPKEPKLKEFKKAPPKRPSGLADDIEPLNYSMKYNTLREGIADIKKKTADKIKEIKNKAVLDTDKANAEYNSKKTVYNDIMASVDDFIKSMNKSKDIVEWANSDKTLGVVEMLDNASKTLPDGDLKIEVENLLNSVYEMADLNNTKLLDRKMSKEFMTDSLNSIKEKIKTVNKEAIKNKREKIKELKDTYKELIKSYRKSKKTNTLDVYEDIDIDAYKAKIEALNREVGGILKEDQTLPFRAIQMHKDMVKATKEGIENGVLSKIDTKARLKTLGADNVQMARLGAVINKFRLLADRSWYEFSDSNKVEGKILKDGFLDNKYFNVRELLGDFDGKNIVDTPKGFARKVINPKYYERFEKLYNKAYDLFGQVKQADGTYRYMNQDEFALVYFKFLGDLNDTKAGVKRWTGEKLNLGDLRGYFKDTDSMIKFMTIEDESIQRIGYVKNNREMLNYYIGGMSKQIAERSVLGTSLNRFISMIELQSKNAQSSMKKALGKAGADQVKTAHEAMIGEAVKKLRIYSDKSGASSPWRKSGADRMFEGIRSTLMASILNMIGIMETGTNPVTVGHRYGEYMGGYGVGKAIKGWGATMVPSILKMTGNWMVEGMNVTKTVVKPMYNAIADYLKPIIDISKFNMENFTEFDFLKFKSAHKYVNNMIQKIRSGNMADRHLQMAEFTNRGGLSKQGWGKRIGAAVTEMAYSMQKDADYQKKILAGTNAYSAMEFIRDLPNMEALKQSQSKLRNLLKEYGIFTDDDLRAVQDFLKRNTGEDGTIDLDFFDYANMMKNGDVDDLVNIQNSYGLFSGLYGHMEDYMSSTKFEADNNSFLSKVWSFLRKTTTSMGASDLKNTFYTMDDNGLYVNRFKHGMDQYSTGTGKTFGAVVSGLGIGFNTSVYMGLLGIGGIGASIIQTIVRKPLDTSRQVAQLKGEYDEMVKSCDWSNDGVELGEHLVGLARFLVLKGARQYPAFAFIPGGNFINDSIDDAYRILGKLVQEVPWVRQNVAANRLLKPLGLDAESIEKKANGHQFGDFRDGGLYSLWKTFLGGNAYSGAIDAAIAFGETNAQTEIRKSNDLKRLEYQFQDSETGRIAAKEMYRTLSNISFQIADAQNTTDSMVAETYLKMANKEKLLSDDEKAELENAVVELSGIPQKVKEMPPKVKEAAEKIPEFIGAKTPMDKMEVQKAVLSSVVNGNGRLDTINAITGNNAEGYETYIKGDPKALTGTRKKMYNDMKSTFDITNDNELFRIICSSKSPKEAYEEIEKQFKPRAEFVSKMDKDKEFSENLPFIFSLEGGYLNDPASKEESMYGITRETAAKHGYYGDMRQLPKELAADIYKKSYYDPVAKLTNDKATLAVLFDAAVNHGLGYAKEIHKKIGDNPQALIQERIRKYHAIANNNPAKAKFLNNWMSRMEKLEDFIAKKGYAKNENTTANTLSSINDATMANFMQREDTIIPREPMEEEQSPEIAKILSEPLYDEDEKAPEPTQTFGVNVSPETRERLDEEAELKPIKRENTERIEEELSKPLSSDNEVTKIEIPTEAIPKVDTAQKTRDNSEKLEKKWIKKLLNQSQSDEGKSDITPTQNQIDIADIDRADLKGDTDKLGRLTDDSDKLDLLTALYDEKEEIKPKKKPTQKVKEEKVEDKQEEMKVEDNAEDPQIKNVVEEGPSIADRITEKAAELFGVGANILRKAMDAAKEIAKSEDREEDAPKIALGIINTSKEASVISNNAKTQESIVDSVIKVLKPAKISADKIDSIEDTKIDANNYVEQKVTGDTVKKPQKEHKVETKVTYDGDVKGTKKVSKITETTKEIPKSDTTLKYDDKKSGSTKEIKLNEKDKPKAVIKDRKHETEVIISELIDDFEHQEGHGDNVTTVKTGALGMTDNKRKELERRYKKKLTDVEAAKMFLGEIGDKIDSKNPKLDKNKKKSLMNSIYNLGTGSLEWESMDNYIKNPTIENLQEAILTKIYAGGSSSKGLGKRRALAYNESKPPVLVAYVEQLKNGDMIYYDKDKNIMKKVTNKTKKVNHTSKPGILKV